MKSLKTKVIMSAVVLVFALIATIGSTYAWFTVSNQVAVSNIDLDVVTADSLLIQIQDDSTDAEDGGADLGSGSNYGVYFPDGLDSFQSNITTVELNNSTQYTDYENFALTPLTAGSAPSTGAGYTDYTALDITDLSYLDFSDSDRTLYSGSKNTAAGGYIEFNFWLIYSGQEVSVDVALQNLAVSNISGSAEIENALAFGVEGDQAEATSTKNVYAFDPDYGFSFSSSDAGYLGTGTPSYDSIPGATQTTLIGLHSLFLDSAAVANVSTTTLLSADTICTLTPNTPELVSFRIYIEGWDAQATNSLSSTSFNLTFGFVIKA